MSATSLTYPLGGESPGNLALIEAEIRKRAATLKQAISISPVEGSDCRFRLAGEDKAFAPVEVATFYEALAFLRGAEFGANHAWTACAIKRQGAAWRVVEGVEALRGEDFAVFASERFAEIFAEGMGHGSWRLPSPPVAAEGGA